jgi:hypothetical protein
VRKFFKKVNRNDRVAMVGYLIDHEAHDGYFSNTIKVHSLGLTPDQLDLLAPWFELGDSFTGIFDVILTNLGAEEFLNVEIGGRMGGHVELRATTWKCR